MPDPVANAIDALLDHVHAMDEQMKNMCHSIKSLGMEIDEVKLPDLGPCDIVSEQKYQTKLEEDSEEKQ